MAITASLVKELRERTGAGMMECKKALVESNGDIEAAIEAMRKSGQAKAAKKAGRVAADGVIELRISDDGRQGVMVEINSETDFVAKDDNFGKFAEAVGQTALTSGAASVEALSEQAIAGAAEGTVETARAALVAKVGENVQLRRLVRVDNAKGTLHGYRHGVRIAVMVELEGGDAQLGRDLAMHVAASNPLCVDASEIPAETLEKERDIFRTQALESGKPENIVDKIIEGRVRKYIEEITLLGQPFVKDPDQSVEQLLKQAGAKVLQFARLEVGEGIEKKTENFAEEVQAQARQGS